VKVTLYTTAGCHLCEQALDMLQTLQRDGMSLTVCEVDISESESLMEAYGVRIPVIATGEYEDDLGWPFSIGELTAFIKREV